jgi:hypothetical protein
MLIKPDSAAGEVAGAPSSRRGRLAPVAALVFLAPVIAELLFGIVRLSNLWLLLPEMGVYGLGAVIVRDVARRRGLGWNALLLFGLAFAVALEGVILQTSLTPQFFPPGGSASFGWAFGVQWLYLVAMVVYESVFAIVIPVQLGELLFPARRHEPWLARGELAAACAVFLVASVGVWWLWHHVGLPRYGPSDYRVPPSAVGLALLGAVSLAAGALKLRPRPRRDPPAGRRAWSPWLLGPLAFGFTLPWFILVALPFVDPRPLAGAPPLVPLGLGLAWAALAYLGVSYVSTGRAWHDSQRLALIFGALLASMLGGFLFVLAASPLDQIGKLGFDLLAAVLLAYLAWRLRRRGPAGH